jgi:VWFA-related protein
MQTTMTIPSMNKTMRSLPFPRLAGQRARTIAMGAAVAMIAAARVAGAQVIGGNAPVGGTPTYTLSKTVRLVVETVVVKDKKGNAINGLTDKDFTVTEDGVAQTITFCEHQTVPEEAEPLPPAPPGGENIQIYNKLARSSIAAEKPGDIRYRDKRLIALYFDMSGMPQMDQFRALDAAMKFVRTNMTSADLLSIMRYADGSIDVLQDFTGDRNRLLSILQTMVVGEGQGDIESSSGDASSADTGAAFGQDDSEFNIFNTDRQLAALQTAAQMLGQLNEKKSLVYFASGIRLNGIDNQAQMNATVNAALRAGVSFWPIDARGLVASAPLGDATHGSPGGQGMYSGAAALAVTGGFQQSQDTLYALGGDTGGKALLDNNDLGKGIVDAQHAVSNYYIVGYYSTNTALDGKFRKVKVTVNPTLDANLDFRQGYYAGKKFSAFTAADKDRNLEEAFMLGDPITDLTIAMEINYFELNRAEYFVPIMVKIPGSELALAKKRGAEEANINFIIEIKDAYGGTTETNVHDVIPAKLSDKTAEELAKVPVEYSTGFTLLPGKHIIKFLARDDITGRIGTYQTTFVIPNLQKETKRVPTSSVVLSSQRVKDAIYDVTKAKDQAKEAAANPLVQNGQKMIPSVTRVFSKARDIYVYLQAYEPPVAAAQPAAAGAQPPAPPAPSQPLIAFVTLYSGQTKAYETQPIEVKAAPGAHLGMIPLNFDIAPAQLPAGRYDCQVTVLDPVSQKATFWQAPIMLVP